MWKVHLGVSKNNGTPKSSILIGFSIINHPFWGTPIFGNTHLINFDPKGGAKIWVLRDSWRSASCAKLREILRNQFVEIPETLPGCVVSKNF